MDHPLCHEDNSALRRRVIQLLREGYNVRREGNIIFVCGGNEANDMRTRFKAYCIENHPEFKVFLPEYAMKSYLSTLDTNPFNIADFETLIADLSHVIVLFPEAPGSFAETGYFSAKQELASKTILAMDLKWQSKDSFISIGPAKKIEEISRFSGTIQIPYDNPPFFDIIARIQRYPLSKHKKSLDIKSFKATSNYERFCLIHKCVSLLKIATIDDILFIFRGIFRSQLSASNVKQLTSILVGAGYLSEASEYGHFSANRDKEELLSPKTGFRETETEIQLQLAVIFSSGHQDFLDIIERSRNAA